MKHQQQGWNDCILTTYAMLVDKPRVEVHEVAFQCAQRMAITWINNWWNTIDTLHRDYGPQALDEYCTRIRWSLGMPEEYHPPHSGHNIPNNYSVEKDSIRPDLRGKGSIAVTFGWMSHIVAFENLTIYDGNNIAPTTWRGFVTSYKSVQVYGWLIARYPDGR